MNLSWLNSICYTIGWFFCVIFGVQGHSILATIGAIFLILFQLYSTKINDIALYIQDLILATLSIPLGFFLEIFFIQTNLIYYTDLTENFPPIWIICLYPLFSLLLNHSLKFIKRNYLISFLFGFLGGPLSYIGGQALGAVNFSYPLKVTLLIIGVCFGLFLCLLRKIADIIEKATKETLKDRDSTSHLELLYDGQCPICKQEICMLQKKDDQRKIKFTDISSKEFFPFEETFIDYKTAMSQIHAIEDKKNIFNVLYL